MTLRELMERVKNYWGAYSRPAVGQETFGYIHSKVSEKYLDLLYDIMMEEIPSNWTPDVKAVKECVRLMKARSEFHKRNCLELEEPTEEEKIEVEEILGGKSVMEYLLERKNCE